MDEQTIFVAALEHADATERAAYLNDACGGDSELRARVEVLLEAERRAGSFMQSPPDSIVDAQIAEQPGDCIGGYQLLEQIGEGGFGVVYLAEQQAPVRRPVALKIIKPGMDTKQVIARFDAERQALALMDHPNIAKVLDGGSTSSGRPYFIMELVRGVPITEYCKRCRLDSRDRLKLFITVCHAVQHAHQKGIIHRDLKPSNVLVAMQDGHPSPRIIDFGVAKAINHRLTEHTLRTRFAQLVGTPLYMSPEQAEMSPLDVDTRTDIYALGVILYELITGTTPYERGRLSQVTYDELRRILREEEPQRPSARLSTLRNQGPTIAETHRLDTHKLIQFVRGDLDWIIMRALEKDRTRRYPTANGLARDIERFLTDEPVEARPPSAAYRLHKFARRNRLRLTIGALFTAAVLVGLVGTTVQAIRANKAESVALANLRAKNRALESEARFRQEAERERDVARHQLYRSRVTQARAGRQAGHVGQYVAALASIIEAKELALKLELGPSSAIELRHEAIGCLAKWDADLIRGWQSRGPHGPFCDPQLDHYLLTHERGRVSVRRTSDSGEVAVLTIPEEDQNGGRVFPRFSPDGRLLATAWQHPLLVWDWRRGEIILRTSFDQPLVPYATGFSPDSRRLAVAHPNGEIAVVDIETGVELMRVRSLPAAQRVRFSPDGSRLAICGFSTNEVQIRDATDGKLLQSVKAPAGVPETSWHPAGRLLAVPSNDFNVHIFDSLNGTKFGVLRGHRSLPHGLQFADDGAFLSSWSYADGIRLWDAASCRELLCVDRGIGRISHDGQRLIARQGTDYELHRVIRAEVHKTIPRQSGSVHVAVSHLSLGDFSPDGRWLAVPGTTHNIGGIGLYDLSRVEPVAYFGFAGTDRVVFSPSGTDLITAGSTGVFRWPFLHDENVLTIGPPRQIGSGRRGQPAVSQAGKFLVSAARQQGVVEVISLDTQEVVHQLDHWNCYPAAVSNDSRWIATGTNHGNGVKVWDAESGQLQAELARESSSAIVDFSPVNGELISSGKDEPIRVWKSGSWELIREIPRHGEKAFDVSRQGALVLKNPSGLVELMDLESGRSIATLESPDDLGESEFLFSPDGSVLLTISILPESLRYWDLRRLRAKLSALGLDWDVPSFSDDGRPSDATSPVRVNVDVGEFAHLSVTR